MTRSVVLDAQQRQALLDRYRKDHDPEVRFRAHILLLLAEGHTWATVATLLFCSSRTIDRWVKRFQREGVEGLAGHKPGRPFRFAASWIAVVVEWVTAKAPREFGFLRSRWCCEAVAILMLELHHVEVSRETVKKAELLAFVETSDRPRKYYVGRDLRRVFRLAGLARCTVRSVAFTRQAPLDSATRSFLEGYLEDLRRRAGPHLEPSLRELFNRLANPGSSQYVLSSPDLCVTCVNHVVVGVRPGRKRSQG